MKDYPQTNKRYEVSTSLNQSREEDNPTAPEILILGVGNILLSDEGAGIKALQELKRQYIFPAEVELLDAGTSGMQLLPWIENRSSLFILDVVDEKEADYGAVFQYNFEDPPAFIRKKSTSHQIGLHEVLAFAQMSDTLPSRIVLFGIRPQSMETGLELTPKIREGVQELTDLVIRELERSGLSPTKLHY